MPPEILEGDVEVVEAPTLRESIEEAVETLPAEPEAKATPEVPVVTEPKTGTPPAQPTTETQAPPAAEAPRELKAPNGWKAQAREKWNVLPREIQEEVVRRENDLSRLVGSVGPKIRLADEVAEKMAPFAERLMANNVQPTTFLNDTFATIGVLLDGSPQNKAEAVANIIQAYGVPLPVLDQLLTRRMTMPPEYHRAQQDAQRAQVQLQQYQSAERQTKVNTANQTVDSFASDPQNEFFPQVSSMMADLLEQGRAQSMADAYTAACWATPEVRGVLLQREAQARATARNNRANAARNAASAVHGVPTTPTPTGIAPGMNLRDTIAAAMDAADAA